MSKPKEVHLVVGDKGEYSDWTTWVVAGYFHKDTAESHAARLNEIIRIFNEGQGQWNEEVEAVALKALAVEDPGQFGSKHSYLGSYLPSYDVATHAVKDAE